MSRRNSCSSRKRQGIFAFITISVALLLTLLLCKGIGVFVKYINNNNNSNLEGNQIELVSNNQRMLLMNEFAAKSNGLNNNKVNMNKHESNNNNNSNMTNYKQEQNYQIKIVDGNSHYNKRVLAFRGNNITNLMASNSLPITHHNRFVVGKINTGNQHGEFNENLTAMKSITATAAGRLATVNSSDVANAAAGDANSNSRGGGESAWTKYETIQRQREEAAERTAHLHASQSNRELVVLHRQKRYLIFPEGSSFQMVFDLIIGMVDYTSYLILGITCAVAWELPSKPPSELIENLHDKVTEGLYTTSETKPPPAAATATATASEGNAAAMRRNDSIIVAVNKNGGNDRTTKYSTTAVDDRIKYVDNANMGAHTYMQTYEDMMTAQVMKEPLPPPTLQRPPPTAPSPPQNAMETAYYTQSRPPKPPPQSTIINNYNAYQKVSDDRRYYTTDDDDDDDGAYQTSNYYANSNNAPNYNSKNVYNSPNKFSFSFADKNKKSSHYGDVNDGNSFTRNSNRNPLGYSAYGDPSDKQPAKFVNRWEQQEQEQQQRHPHHRHQQPQFKKWHSGQHFDSRDWWSYQKPKQTYVKWTQQQQKAKPKWATQSQFAGSNSGWWSSSKQQQQQRVENIWRRTKENDLREKNVRIPVSTSAQPRQPVMTYSPPAAGTANPKSGTVQGRNFDSAPPRLRLTKPPKAKIYPVFGRRRRRSQRSSSSSSNAKLNTLELKLERVHLREQLRTRQKLFGKIEKLYETRGMNGTACVLRAICETRQQQNEHEVDDEPEPQSFITELLRAIFTLPTIGLNSAGETVGLDEPALHHTDFHLISRTYREAHAHRGNCAQLFSMCEHSLWE